jgi:hypothetical protein
MKCLFCKYKKDKTAFLDGWLDELGLTRRQLVLLTKILKEKK